MISIEIPGQTELLLKYAVFDMNGTLTTDGIIAEETKKKLQILADKLKIIILTADTFGKAKTVFKDSSTELHILDNSIPGAEAKLNFIEKLGVEHCVAVGNGSNDFLMLKHSALGIAVTGEEGLSVKAVCNADIVVKRIDDAIDLLLNTKRIKATLRL